MFTCYSLSSSRNSSRRISNLMESTYAVKHRTPPPHLSAVLFSQVKRKNSETIVFIIKKFLIEIIWYLVNDILIYTASCNFIACYSSIYKTTVRVISGFEWLEGTWSHASICIGSGKYITFFLEIHIIQSHIRMFVSKNIIQPLGTTYRISWWNSFIFLSHLRFV